MCRKVHFKAGVIFHHPVCVASDASLTQNTSLDHFREKYFLLFKCAFEKLNQNSPFGISFGICPHPSQLLPALKHFCQKITLCFQPEFKFLGKHYLSSTILNKFKKRYQKSCCWFHFRVITLIVTAGHLRINHQLPISRK